MVRKTLCLVFILLSQLQPGEAAANEPKRLLKGIKMISYLPIIEKTVGGNNCKIDIENLNTSLQFIADQSSALKILSNAAVIALEGERFNRLKKESDNFSEQIKTLSFDEASKLFQGKNKKLKAAGDAADEYNFVPTFLISFTPMQIAGGCAATLDASLTAFIEPTKLKKTHADVYNETIEIWSLKYAFVGPQPAFSNYAINMAEQVLKQLVNDWAASQ